MEYSPPPLFKQGASARVKVVLFSLIAIGLLVMDSRMHSLSLIRQVVGSTLYPLQMVALVPRDSFNRVEDYFASLENVQKENRALKSQQSAKADLLQQSQQLLAENTQLRKLLGASERLPVQSLMSEILYDARDAFTRKIVLDRGSQQGVALGQPVIDDVGVVGQVTRIFPLTAEVTLLTDKDQAISVQVVRSGLRSVAYGRGSGVLDLKFMATNADIQKGDMLVTSGIDGVFPAGLSVAKVLQVENKSNDAFAHIVCQPLAGVDRNRQLLILLVDPRAPRLEPEEPKDKKDKFGRHHTESAKESSKEASKEASKESAKESTKEAVAPAAAVTPAKPTVPAQPTVPAVPAAPAPAAVRSSGR
jgi:rod shape-determining protein MreC